MKKIFTLFIAVLVIVASYAAPARRGWQTKTQPDGTTIEVQLVGDEFYHYWINRKGETVKCDENGYWQVLAEQPAHAIEASKRRTAAKRLSRQKSAGAPALGSQKGLVILANFKDESFQSVNTQSAMNDMMNGDNYNYDCATGSVRKYFSDQSGGIYTPEFDVVGPVTLPYNMAHYGANNSDGNDILAGNIIVEACSIANALYNVDFTKYDNDGDDYVDFVYVLFAGIGEADGGDTNTIWPHAWSLDDSEYFNRCSYNASQRTFDGKIVNNYACSSEMTTIKKDHVVVDKVRTGIGTIAHEFSHVIGLNDLYDTNYGQNDQDKMTPGLWHIMDDGLYNNNGKTPPGYTVYDKYYLGWVTPENPGNIQQTLTLNAGDGYQISNSDSLVSATSLHTTYYIENRQNEGWDAHLPGQGLLIWKIMYNPLAWNNNVINNTIGNIRYALISATGKTTDIGTAADVFPGTENTTGWTGVRGKSLTNINESNGVITLDYAGNGGDESIEPEEIHIENLHYANAFYYDNEGVKYYYFDIYNEKDTATDEMTYPEITFTVVAKSKTAINGTYDIIRGDFWRSSGDMVDIDATQPATVTIQNMNNNGKYNIKGTFVCEDNITYSFDAEVYVSAKESDNEDAEITLNESTDPTGIENINCTTSATHKILRNGQLLIINNENTYRANGQKIQK